MAAPQKHLLFARLTRVLRLYAWLRGSSPERCVANVLHGSRVLARLRESWGRSRETKIGKEEAKAAAVLAGLAVPLRFGSGVDRPSSDNQGFAWGLNSAEEGLEKFAPDRTDDGDLYPQYSLDIGIRHYVLVLRAHGVETCQSCQGGPGHAYLEPTIEFRGDAGEGLRAVGIAISQRLPVSELRRVWNVHGRELDGPIWTITFDIRADVWLAQEKARTEAYFASVATGRDAC